MIHMTAFELRMIINKVADDHQMTEAQLKDAFYEGVELTTVQSEIKALNLYFLGYYRDPINFDEINTAFRIAIETKFGNDLLPVWGEAFEYAMSYIENIEGAISVEGNNGKLFIVWDDDNRIL